MVIRRVKRKPANKKLKTVTPKPKKTSSAKSKKKGVSLYEKFRKSGLIGILNDTGLTSTNYKDEFRRKGDYSDR